MVADDAGARSGYLLKIAERIEAEAADFARLEALNCGKPINAVLNDEIRRSSTATDSSQARCARCRAWSRPNTCPG